MRQITIGQSEPYLLPEVLERLRWCSGYRDEKRAAEWLEILGVRESDYESFLCGGKELPDHALEALCERVKVTPRQLRSGQVDFHEITLLNSPLREFPERYRVAAFGRRRTTIHAVNFVEKKCGWRVRSELLEGHGIGECLLTDPMGTISIQCLTDICDVLRTRYAYVDGDFFRMGTYAGLARQNPALCTLLDTCESPAEIYERLFSDLMRFFEHNCRYLVQNLESKKCVVDVMDRRSIAEALERKNLGSPSICALKAGWMSAAPAYLGLPFATVRELKCVHRGDAVCRFEIDFEEAAILH